MTIELNTLGAVIKTTYEAEQNTNAFTDAEKLKLANLNPSQFSGSWNDLTDRPDLFSGSWGELTDKPAYIAAGATRDAVVSDLAVIPTSMRGVANGVAPLDASGIVPNQFINISGLSFLGAWDASTNMPALLDGSGEAGQFYKCGVAGTHDFGNGQYTFAVGDWVMYAGGTWQRIGVHEQVQSVNAKTGAVVLTASDVGAMPSSYVQTWATISGIPATASRWPTHAEVTGKPETATRWPTYAEVTGKPRNYVHRGTISAPIAAARRSFSSQEIATGTVVTLTSASGGYDVYGATTGERITPPSWASHIRITANLTIDHLATTSHVWASITRNGSVTVSAAVSSGQAAQTYPSMTMDTGIVPITTGDYYTIRVYHNDGANRNIRTISYYNVEFFETIP